MTPAEVLQPICSTDDARSNIATPFGMDFKEHRWLVATDGHCAVALLVDNAELRKDAPDLAGVVLNHEPPPGFRANVDLLKEWAGPVPGPLRPCEKCDGDGSVECPTCGSDDYECKECSGFGTLGSMPPNYGAIFSGVLNRVLLARVLATLPEGTTEVRIGQREPLSPYILRAKRWLAAIMPMMSDVKAESKFTELEPVAA